MQKRDKDNLKFRYLLWMYKMTKDELDRIERKFTQLDVDKGVLKYMSKNVDFTKVSNKVGIEQFIREFSEYITKKERDARALSSDKKKLNPRYYSLILKLEAIESVAVKQLGRKAADEIKALYEDEMKKRILESREHR